MGTKKQVDVRISNKHDIEANWVKATSFIPMKGEIIVYDAETSNDALPTGRTIRVNYPRFKIGDGVKTVANLPFVLENYIITHSKSGITHSLTNPEGKAGVFSAIFISTNNFAEGDVIHFNNELYIASAANGQALPNNYFITGSNVFCVIDTNNKTINFNSGYIPTRGTDYWTEEDKAEIKSYVDEAILGGEW